MNHMNYNWPNRGVQYPYPPSAPTTNASSNSQTAFPYQHQQQTTSSYSTPNTYTPPAGYSHAGSYNSAAPTYTNSNAYGGTGHHSGVNSYTSATASNHPNYSPAVAQRQHHNTAPTVDFKDHSTVAPGTPLSTGNNSSAFSRNSSLAAPNQQQSSHSQAAQAAQAQAQVQAQRQAQAQQAQQQAREQQRQQEQREQAAQAQAAAEAAQAARAEQAREQQREQQRQEKERRQQEQRKQREQQQREQQQQLQRERERELREQQLRDAQLQESPKQKSQQQQPSSSRIQTQEPAQASSSGQKSESHPPFTKLPEGATPAPKRKSMGRLGDADVHQAFVEFRAKDTDKCMSAQCIHCDSVRAKNTSRQRQHLLECQAYLQSMRESNPNHPILEMAAQHAAGRPMKDIIRPGTTSANGTPNGVGAFGTPNGQLATPTQPSKRLKVDHVSDGVVVQTGTLSNGWGGGSLAPTHTLPPPRLERDFQLAIQLNPRIDVGKNTFGAETYWTSFISGHWNGRWGKGTVVPGGQDKQHVSTGNISNGAGAVHTETNFLLQTHDHPTAFITVKMEGWRTSNRDIMEQLMDPSRVDSVDPRTYTHRCFVTMETGDERYADLNTGMWLGSVVRKATEVVYDAYRIS